MRYGRDGIRAVALALMLLLGGCGHASETAPDNTTYPLEKLQDPETCKDCHPKHYQEWSGSMHAYASDDPLFLALNKRGQEQAQIGDFCVKCHAPMAVATHQTSDGLNLAELPKQLHGVTCFFCHQVDGVLGTHDNPLHLANDGVMRGQYSDPVKNKAHNSAYSELHDDVRLQSSAMCGSCHDIVNTKGAHLERTFSEWQDSVFNQEVGGTSCNACHMRTRHNELAAEGADAPGVFLRKLVHEHSFPGVDVALTAWPETDAQQEAVTKFLDTSLRLAVCVQDVIGSSAIWVITDTIGVGHNFPSGASQDRRVWFEVTAYDSADAVVYKSGAVPPGTEPTTLQDPDFWLFRDCTLDADGKEVHDFWNPATIDAVSAPAPGSYLPLDPRTYRSHITRRFPQDAGVPVSPARVTVQVWLQAFPLDVFDDLFANDPAAAAMRAKLAPVKVIEQTWRANDPTNERLFQNPLRDQAGLPMTCASDRMLQAGATNVRSPKHQACSP
jgi:hypothetical protein